MVLPNSLYFPIHHILRSLSSTSSLFSSLFRSSITMKISVGHSGCSWQVVAVIATTFLMCRVPTLMNLAIICEADPAILVSASGTWMAMAHVSLEQSTAMAMVDLTCHVIATRMFLAADVASRANFDIFREIFRSSSGPLGVSGTSCCNLFAGLPGVPDGIAGDTSAPVACHADYVTVFLRKALLARITVWVTTALELTIGKTCL